MPSVKFNIQITTGGDVPEYTDKQLGEAVEDDMRVQGMEMLRDALPMIVSMGAHLGQKIGSALSEMGRKAAAYDRQRAQADVGVEPRPAEHDCDCEGSGSGETPGTST